MNKKMMMFLGVAVLLMTFVIAAEYVFEISPATIPATVGTEPSTTIELITFDCGGKSYEVNGSESDGDWSEDDILFILKMFGCTEEKTNIWKEGKQLKKNKYGDFGFDEDKLKEKECHKEGKEYDKDKKCKDKIVEVA